MKISTLFLFVVLGVLSCASPSVEQPPVIDLSFDSGKENTSDMADADSRDGSKDLNSADLDLDSGRDSGLDSSADVADFDREKYEMCFDEGVVKVDEVEPAILDEISGIAVSRTQNIIWVHNDSGDADGRFYAIDFAGELRGTFVIDGATSVDWEDMALMERDGKTYLFFGDIGDNDARGGGRGRSNVVVYRVEEPVVDLNENPTIAQNISEHESYKFRYPEGATDCEALFADPLTGDLYFLEKTNDGNVFFFRAPVPVDGSNTTLESLVEIGIPTPDYPGSSTTAGSISEDGKWIIVKTYTSVLLFPWRRSTSFASAVSIAPIVLPVPREIQGESIDFGDLGDGSGVITISEGANPAINFIKDTCK